MNQPGNWKARIYVLGVLGGAAFGLVSAYLFARAAEEDVAHNKGQPRQLPTTTLIALVLSALGLARQIAEAGKPKK